MIIVLTAVSGWIGVNVMSKQIKINLNDWIKGKLTPYGKEVYTRFFDGLPENIEVPDVYTDTQGLSKFQLWEFIEIFGQYIYMGAENVIEPLDLYWSEQG